MKKTRSIYLIIILILSVGSYYLYASIKSKDKNMQYLAIFEMNEGVKMTDFIPYVDPEADRAWELYQENKLLELFFVKGQNTPILKITAASEAEAIATLNTLPMVKNKLFRFELMQLMPYEELGKRMKKDGQDRPDWWPEDSF